MGIIVNSYIGVLAKWPVGELLGLLAKLVGELLDTL
jgi:hypothetical protein